MLCFKYDFSNVEMRHASISPVSSGYLRCLRLPVFIWFQPLNIMFLYVTLFDNKFNHPSVTMWAVFIEVGNACVECVYRGRKKSRFWKLARNLSIIPFFTYIYNSCVVLSDKAQKKGNFLIPLQYFPIPWYADIGQSS